MRKNPHSSILGFWTYIPGVTHSLPLAYLGILAPGQLPRAADSAQLPLTAPRAAACRDPVSTCCPPVPSFLGSHQTRTPVPRGPFQSGVQVSLLLGSLGTCSADKEVDIWPPMLASRADDVSS